jgi:S-adenosylmethionine hydrolase
MKRSVITLLTDFGVSDHYVGAMKGVLSSVCPAAQLIDISHQIAPYAIPEAAFTLAQAWHCFPKGTVHLVVVDPGVGSSRRPIIAEAAGHHFVAPDNGVLTMLFDSVPGHKVREITASRYFRRPVSQTFHGRDIFAPVAAHLASGVPPGKFGRRINDYLRADFTKPVRTGPDKWTGSILKIDRFGNLITNFESTKWDGLGDQTFEVTIGDRRISRMASSYAEVPAGELFLIQGSAGYLEVSINKSSAADLMQSKPGIPVELLIKS